MNRTIKNLGEILVNNNELVVEIQSAEIKTWIAEVTLLVEGLVNKTTVLSGKQKFSIEKGPADADKSKCVVGIGHDGFCSFILPLNHCEYLQATLLKAYRDEAADVDHIHLDGMEGDNFFDLTVMFDQSKPPLSPEEMQKHLDR